MEAVYLIETSRALVSGSYEHRFIVPKNCNSNEEIYNIFHRADKSKVGGNYYAIASDVIQKGTSDRKAQDRLVIYGVDTNNLTADQKTHLEKIAKTRIDQIDTLIASVPWEDYKGSLTATSDILNRWGLQDLAALPTIKTPHVNEKSTPQKKPTPQDGRSFPIKTVLVSCSILLLVLLVGLFSCNGCITSNAENHSNFQKMKENVQVAFNNMRKRLGLKKEKEVKLYNWLAQRSKEEIPDITSATITDEEYNTLNNTDIAFEKVEDWFYCLSSNPSEGNKELLLGFSRHQGASDSLPSPSPTDMVSSRLRIYKAVATLCNCSTNISSEYPVFGVAIKNMATENFPTYKTDDNPFFTDEDLAYANALKEYFITPLKKYCDDKNFLKVPESSNVIIPWVNYEFKKTNNETSRIEDGWGSFISNERTMIEKVFKALRPE